jgi:hypothetical protein
MDDDVDALDGRAQGRRVGEVAGRGSTPAPPQALHRLGLEDDRPHRIARAKAVDDLASTNPVAPVTR